MRRLKGFSNFGLGFFQSVLLAFISVQAGPSFAVFSELEAVFLESYGVLQANDGKETTIVIGNQSGTGQTLPPYQVFVTPGENLLEPGRVRLVDTKTGAELFNEEVLLSLEDFDLGYRVHKEDLHVVVVVYSKGVLTAELAFGRAETIEDRRDRISRGRHGYRELHGSASVPFGRVDQDFAIEEETRKVSNIEELLQANLSRYLGMFVFDETAEGDLEKSMWSLSVSLDSDEASVVLSDPNTGQVIFHSSYDLVLHETFIEVKGVAPDNSADFEIKIGLDGKLNALVRTGFALTREQRDARLDAGGAIREFSFRDEGENSPRATTRVRSTPSSGQMNCVVSAVRKSA